MTHGCKNHIHIAAGTMAMALLAITSIATAAGRQPRAETVAGKVIPSQIISKKPHGRIVGGSFAPDGAYPWTAALLSSSGSQICGGSLIAPTWVVTAAHCTSSTASVRVGSVDRTSGGQVIRVIRKINHPQYSTQNDIALLELETPVSGITPITRGTTKPAVGSALRLLGWGQVTSPFGGDSGSRYLKMLDTTVLTLNTCTISPGPGDICVRGTTTATACKGDSGGPALENSLLVGATSRSGRNANYCGEDVIYTDVTYYKPWIDSHVNGGSDPIKLFEQTDASGKVTIAVFERTSSVSQSHNTDFTIAVPTDYVVIGGGGMGKNAPEGNLLTASYPNAHLSAWLVSTKDHIKADTVSVRGWAIGLKIAGLTADQLRGHLAVSTATSGFTAHPDVTATVPAGFTLVGGGFKVNWSGVGNLGTASAPSGTNGWRARSKDHIQSSPATTAAFAIGLRSDIPGIGNFASQVGTSLSGVAAHPSTSASVPAGYALSGCGAFVNWSGVGNLLWRIQPALVGGTQTACSVASKDHVEVSAASIHGYAIGVRGF